MLILIQVYCIEIAVERRGAFKVWMENPEGKLSLGKSRRRWENNVQTGM